MIHIECIDLPKEVDLARLERAVRRSFALGKRVLKGRVSVRFVSSTEIQRLNRQWRKKNKPTDVLSFPQPEIPGEKERFWGDVVIALSVVKQEARRRRIDLEEEVARMTVHGILHLCGYDHGTEEEEMNMFAIQERVLAECYE